MYPVVNLKKGREKSLLRRHPWVFSGAVSNTDDGIEPGGLVFLEAGKKMPLATGYFNPYSDIRIRVLDFKERPIDEAFFKERLGRAVELRKALFHSDIDAWRLVNSEGDGLPGLVIDRYAKGLVASVETMGMERLKPIWIKVLQDLLKPDFIFEASDKDKRERHKSERATRKLLAGDLKDGLTQFNEGELKYCVDVERGQKTGFYLDQREARSWIQCLAKDKKVLNLFCYSGAFTVSALKGGAKGVVSVDSSRPALELLEKNLALNGLQTSNNEGIEGNVFEYLRQCPEDEFGLVVVDPPSLCRRRADVVKAARAYKDVNRLAFKAAAPGGLMLTYSCSHFFPTDLFGKVIYQAAVEAGRDVQILRRFFHPQDHPVSAFHPEGEYFKGLLLKVN